MVDTDQIKVLLIEDDQDDYLILRDLLGESAPGGYKLDRVATFREGRDMLEKQEHDIYFVDHRLGDGEGMDLVEFARTKHFRKPVVILTGLDDPHVEQRAIKAGAADYLVKGQNFGTQLLERTIRFALERARLEEELDEARQREERLKELRSLENLSAASTTSVTGQAMGLQPLKQSVPAEFEACVEQYGAALELMLEQRAYRGVEHDVPEKMRALAERLGRMRSGPRDVIEIHSAALFAKTRIGTPQKAQVYLEEGRVLLLQLMGQLITFYRRYYPGGR